MPTLKIENEKYKCAENNIRLCIRPTKQETLEQMKKIIPHFKFGAGGSHIWVSLPDNERIAIITGYY